MKIRYNLHIHSCLSPCADDDMTPVNIVAFAKLNGIDAIAVTDHNAIENVEVAMRAGEAFGVVVVPGIEVQTYEDVHVLCLFETLRDLTDFRNSIKLNEVVNRPEVFGNQLIVDEDDGVTGTLPMLLLMNMMIGVDEMHDRAAQYNGIAIPAHIDREGNGMLAILGIVPEEFEVVELSYKAGEAIRNEYSEYRMVITDSDAHTLGDIGEGREMDVDELSVAGILQKLRTATKRTVQ